MFTHIQIFLVYFETFLVLNTFFDLSLAAKYTLPPKVADFANRISSGI